MHKIRLYGSKLMYLARLCFFLHRFKGFVSKSFAEIMIAVVCKAMSHKHLIFIQNESVTLKINILLQREQTRQLYL